jgi:hypothetical protein
MRLSVMFLFALLLGGCAAGTSPQFNVPAGQYAKAFDATRDVLRSYRFTLERVDAAAGIITTAHKATAGLATPWDREQTTLSQEVEDLLNQQSRVVRVTFRPAGEGSENPLDEPVDPKGAMVGRVEVIVYRMQTPGLRPPSRAILLTSVSTDPVLEAEGIGWQYEVPIGQDSRLAARLAGALAKEIGEGAQSRSDDPQSPAQRLARP